MASFDYRLNPLYVIKECSSCGALYTTDYCCSKGGLVYKIVHDPNKTPDSSQQPPQNYARCGNPVDGPYCRGCALLRKKFKEDLFTYCVENGIFQDLQDTFESSNENTNVVNAPQEPFVIPVCYDDDNDEERSIPLKDTIISGLPPCVVITPALSTEEPVDSLIMEKEHLDTILETESDKFIKSSVESLVQNPSESEDFFDIKSECDMPVCDNFTTFSNLLFDANDDFSSSDDESFSDEDFSGELAHNDLIPPGINEADFDLEEDIRFIERLLYDNSSPRPPKAFQANSDTFIESFLTFPIPVEDSDSFREEIDIFPGPDDSIPPGIKSDDDVVEDIPVDVPNILPTHPALHMDFDFIPSINDLGSDLNDSSPSGDRNKIYDLGICIEVKSTRFLATLSPVIDTLIPFSSENDDKVFNHGVLASKKKSPHSSSHRGLKASKLFHHKIPMLIHGDNTPNLGDFPDCDDSRARGFVLHSLEFHILSFILGIPIS
ncbi:hypothetical protein Tco_0045834 [Tanacetum coccineum]